MNSTKTIIAFSLDFRIDNTSKPGGSLDKFEVKRKRAENELANSAKKPKLSDKDLEIFDKELHKELKETLKKEKANATIIPEKPTTNIPVIGDSELLNEQFLDELNEGFVGEETCSGIQSETANTNRLEVYERDLEIFDEQFDDELNEGFFEAEEAKSNNKPETPTDERPKFIDRNLKIFKKEVQKDPKELLEKEKEKANFNPEKSTAKKTRITKRVFKEVLDTEEDINDSINVEHIDNEDYIVFSVSKVPIKIKHIRALKEPNSKEWISDSIIEAYMKIKSEKKNFLFLAPSNALKILTTGALVTRIRFDKYDYMASTVQLEKDHWFLLFLSIRDGFFILIDPIKTNDALVKKSFNNWKKFCTKRNDLNNIDWKLKPCAYNKQRDPYNCGIFVCKFFDCLINDDVKLNAVMNDEKSMKKYRAEIYQKFLLNAKNEHCIKCSQKVNEKTSPKFIECNHMYHKKCLDSNIKLCPICSNFKY